MRLNNVINLKSRTVRSSRGDVATDSGKYGPTFVNIGKVQDRCVGALWSLNTHAAKWGSAVTEADQTRELSKIVHMLVDGVVSLKMTVVDDRFVVTFVTKDEYGSYIYSFNAVILQN
jgi:hypothetical protein